MIRLLSLAVILIALTACATGPSRQQISKDLNNRFDAAKAQIDQKALSGQISWVQAAIQVRELDKKIAANSGIERLHLWKFDSDDEEYHAYCIALAERLDKKQITFAQFDAARTQRFNQIQARRQGLSAQQQIIQNTQPRQQNCVTEKTGLPPFEKFETRCY